MNKYLGLLRWSLKYQDGTKDTEFSAMDEERRKWLMEAIESQVVDPVEQMKNVLDIIKLERPTDISLIEEFDSKQVEALQELFEYIDGFDLARDFKKLGGIETVLQMVKTRDHLDSRVHSLEILSTLSQNHPEIQKYMVEVEALEILLKTLKKENSHVREKAKAVGALGSLLRGHEEASSKFLLEFKALPMLFSLVEEFSTTVPLKDDTEMQSKNRIVRKSLFLIKYFVDNVSGVRGPIKNNFLQLLTDLSQTLEDIDSKEISQNILKILSEPK